MFILRIRQKPKTARHGSSYAICNNRWFVAFKCDILFFIREGEHKPTTRSALGDKGSTLHFIQDKEVVNKANKINLQIGPLILLLRLFSSNILRF